MSHMFYVTKIGGDTVKRYEGNEKEFDEFLDWVETIQRIEAANKIQRSNKTTISAIKKKLKQFIRNI